MTQPPNDAAELDRIRSLALDDPDRIAFESDPEAAARLVLYESFLEGSDLPGSNPDQAELELRRFVANAVAEARPSNIPAEAGWLHRLQHFLRPPLLAPIAALAVVIVAGVIWQTRPPEDAVFRDSDTAVGITLHDSAALEDGGYLLSWKPVEGADEYEIRLFAADLTELSTLGPISALELPVTPADDVADARFWQVVALQAGDAHARSVITALE